MKIFGFEFGRKAREKEERIQRLKSEKADNWIAISLLRAEVKRLKKNKKAHICLEKQVTALCTRQLEIERELNS